MGKKTICHRSFILLLIASALTISAHLAAASNWVHDGWQKINRNDVENALSVWQSGVNALPSSQLLIFIGVYTTPSGAIRQLKRAGIDQKAIILHANFKDKEAYYVMSALDIPADLGLKGC